MTQDADSAKKLTLVVDKCKNALTLKLNEQHQKYFSSLLAWSLSKRAERRMDSFEQLMAIGNDLQAKKVLLTAESDVNSAIEVDSKKWRSFLSRGIICQWKGDSKSAANDFQKVCELEPKKSYGWFNLAEIQFAQQNYESAKANYEKALSITPSDLQAITGLAHCLTKLKQYEKAIDQYNVIIKMRPDSGAALVNRGDAYFAQAEWKKAYDDYSSAAERKTNAVAYQRAAWLLATCKDDEFYQPETALALAKQAIEKSKSASCLMLETLAAAHAACGDFDSAKINQRKAMATPNAETKRLETVLKKYEAEKPYRD